MDLRPPSHPFYCCFRIPVRTNATKTSGLRRRHVTASQSFSSLGPKKQAGLLTLDPTHPYCLLAQPHNSGYHLAQVSVLNILSPLTRNRSYMGTNMNCLPLWECQAEGDVFFIIVLLLLYFSFSSQKESFLFHSASQGIILRIGTFSFSKGCNSLLEYFKLCLQSFNTREKPETVLFFPVSQAERKLSGDLGRG